MSMELREAYRAYLQDPTDYPTIDNYARLLSRVSRKPEHIEFVHFWKLYGGGKILFNTAFSREELEIMVLMVNDEDLDERSYLQPGLYDAIRYSPPWTPWVANVTERPSDSWERVPKSIYVDNLRFLDHPFRTRYSQETRYYVLTHPNRGTHPDNIWHSIYHGPVTLYVTDFHGIPIDFVAPYHIYRITSPRDDSHQDSKWEIDVAAATEFGLIYSDGEKLDEPKVPAP